MAQQRRMDALIGRFHRATRSVEAKTAWRTEVVALLDEHKLEDGGLFEPGPVRAAWGQFLDGNGNLQNGIWGLLQAQAWLERWA